MAVPFLELTKFQKRIIFEFVRQQGYAEGVHKLYQRLKRDISSIQHPAMDSNGDIALNNENEVLEFTDDDLPTVTDDKYLFKGTEYEYETRAVTKKGVVANERRKLLPSRRAIEDYFRKDEMVQIDKQSREANAGGQRGDAYGELGDYAKSRDMLERALAIDERAYGRDHPHTRLCQSALDELASS